MGILKHLLCWPVTGPLFLTEFSLSKVEGVVKEQLTDDSTVKSELLELQLKLELGDITDDEYVAREAELMKQLREIREWREEFGMGVAGGPVRVAQEAKAEPDIPESKPVNSEEAKEPQVADPKDVSIELTFDDWHQ
jgi:hypothetical protein